MDKPATEVQPNADNSVHKAEDEEQDTLEAGAAADQVNLFLQYMIHILHKCIQTLLLQAELEAAEEEEEVSCEAEPAPGDHRVGGAALEVKELLIHLKKDKPDN